MVFNAEDEKSLRNFMAEQDDRYTAIFKELIDLKEDLKSKERVAENERNRIDAWEEAYTTPIKERINYLEGSLKGMYAEELEENPKAKINTPYGKVTKRTGLKYDWFDENAVMASLKDIEPKLVLSKTTYSIDKTAFKKICAVADTGAVVINGEIIEGVTAGRETSFKVEVQEG